MSQWQPIETAPRCSGTGRAPVLVTYYPSTGNYAPVAVARLTVKGWISGKRHNRLWFKPTHWMPLPEPPQSEQSNSAEITLFKKPNDPNERVNKPNYNPPLFEDFDK